MLPAKYLALAALLAASVPTPTLAWTYDEGADVMTDVKSAYIYDGEGYANVMLKCWQKSEPTLVVALQIPFASGDSINASTVSYRFDEGAVGSLPVKKINFNGKVGFLYKGPDLVPILKAVGQAKTRVAFSLNNQAIVLSANGTTAGVEKMLARCGL